MIESYGQWADIFPQMNAHPTKDERIFQTAFRTVKKGDGLMDNIKQKTYFACIVGGDCYGVDVFRQQAVDARKQCEEAFAKVRSAVEYYEQEGKWPNKYSFDNIEILDDGNPPTEKSS